MHLHALTTCIRNLLQLPFLRKLPSQHSQILHNILTRNQDGLLGCDGAISRNAQLKGCKQRVRDFVGREVDVRVCVEALGEEVA
jgi:hypothetical protein